MTDQTNQLERTVVSTPAELAAAREARGMSQLDISQRIKLQLRQIVALEEGQWDALPGRAFVRGALRSYGKLIDADVAPLLESIGGLEAGQAVAAAPLRATSGGTPSSTVSIDRERRGSPMPWVVGGLIGVVALVLYFGADPDGSKIRAWLPFGQKTVDGGAADGGRPAERSGDAAAGTGASASSGGGSGLSGSTSSGSVFGSLSGGGEATVSKAVESAGVAAGGVSTAAAGAVSSGAEAVARESTAREAAAREAAAREAAAKVAQAREAVPRETAADKAKAEKAASDKAAAERAAAEKAAADKAATDKAASDKAAADRARDEKSKDGKAVATADAAKKDGAVGDAAPAKGQLKFTAVDDSWVEVRGADGKPLHQAVLAAGASVTLVGKPPYKITLGNAKRLEVEYEGKARKIPPPSPKNITRLVLP